MHDRLQMWDMGELELTAHCMEAEHSLVSPLLCCSKPNWVHTAKQHSNPT